MLSVSSDIEVNPGSSYPCDSCALEVLDDDPAISCDSCEQWFHIQCQFICLADYETLQACDMSFAWVCLKCDVQNYSSFSPRSIRSL